MWDLSNERALELAARILQEIPPASELWIMPHVRADGDAIGSCLGLKRILTKAGYHARLFLDEEVQESYRLLPQWTEAELWPPEPEKEARLLAECKAVGALFILDCHEASRLGRREKCFEALTPRFIIDHHLFEAQPAEREWIEAGRSSTSEMIVLLAAAFSRLLKKDLFDLEMATSLALGLYTDTGGLRYSNTGVDSYLCMATLRQIGVKIAPLAEALFASRPLSELRAKGLAYSRACWEKDGRLAWVFFKREDMLSCGASDEDLAGICSDLREVRGTDLALFIRLTEEQGQEVLRINLRSSEAFDCSSLARKWGGGGHMRASGASLPLLGRSPEEQLEKILAEARQALSK